jgi:hypothetical protein
MEKYKVKLTFIEEVEATNEQDAIIIAYDGVIASGYNDVKVEKIESENIILCDEQKLYDNNYITQGQLDKLTSEDQ